jgi:hypothetical protein
MSSVGWNYRHEPPCLSYLLKWGLANFLPGLALNHDLPNLYFLNSINQFDFYLFPEGASFSQ